MENKVIKIGDRVELTHVRSATRRKLSENKYISQVLDYDGFRAAKLSMPIYEGKVIPLERGDKYELCFFTSSGMYQSTAVVKRRFREEKMFVALLELEALPKKFQRRQFFRLECTLDMRFRIMSEEELKLIEYIENTEFETMAELEDYEKKLKKFPKEWKSAQLSDISGGGGRFHSRDVSGGKGTIIEVEIPLRTGREMKTFTCFAKVIADEKLVGSSRDNEIRCEFENIDKKKQEMVVKYVFDEQRRRMRKEYG